MYHPHIWYITGISINSFLALIVQVICLAIAIHYCPTKPKKLGFHPMKAGSTADVEF